ncbi:hypothetical protein BDF19DRAFT_261355 [Syncephalis fuscata]|nr:hypothetical protein BDF19DRAFT_261355 [Syncephalis fuscata]
MLSISYVGHQEYVKQVDNKLWLFIKALLKDEIGEKLFTDLEEIIQVAVLDSDGRPTIKLDLMRDISFLLHQFFSHLEFLPLPNIITDTKSTYLSLRNIVLHCPTLLPEQLTIRAVSHVNFSGENPVVRNSVRVVIEQIKGEASDIAFQYRSRRFSRIKHEGLVTVNLTQGNGMRIELLITTPQPGDEETKIKLSLVSVNMGQLRLRFKGKHRCFVYRLVEPTINIIARKMIGKLMADTIYQWARTLDEKMNLPAH